MARGRMQCRGTGAKRECEARRKIFIRVSMTIGGAGGQRGGHAAHAGLLLCTPANSTQSPGATRGEAIPFPPLPPCVTSLDRGASPSPLPLHPCPLHFTLTTSGPFHATTASPKEGEENCLGCLYPGAQVSLQVSPRSHMLLVRLCSPLVAVAPLTVAPEQRPRVAQQSPRNRREGWQAASLGAQ